MIPCPEWLLSDEELFKVFAFLKRNTDLLSHDDYRAAHVGYHCGQSRRLKDIRGYLVNIWSNTSLGIRLGTEWVDALNINAPEDFLQWWDGFPEVYFDNQEAWINAVMLEPTRATAEGLVIDPDWNLDDCPRIFDPVPDRPQEFKPCHLRMHEHVLLPVLRTERKAFKLMHLFKLKDVTGGKQTLVSDYASVVAKWHECQGCIVNFRDSDLDAAMRGFYPEESWGHSPAGQAHRAEFCDFFDGAIEYHFLSSEDFLNARRRDHEALYAIEQRIFSSCWYVEVDENLVVLPNRNPAPAFYFR